MSEQNPLNLEEIGGLASVEKYKFEPIKGYPMLHWHGKRPFTSTQYYPAQKKEVYGEDVNGWINKIFWGDNLQVMSHLLKDFRGKIDLIYIDPPFDSKAEYKLNIKSKGHNVNSDVSGFEEKQYSDIWSNDEYLQFMYERLVLIKELLCKNGSVFLHCDWHKSHHLKCLMDEIFGSESFVNEIVWHYRKWAVKSNNFQRNHDTILWYCSEKDSSRTFNMIETQEASEGTLKRWKGKKQVALFDEAGNRTAASVEDDSEGAPLADVWEMSIINPAARERTAYPTQKPEKLLERIIKHCSNPGDLIFDCFMGSGTTQAVAMKNGRRFIGSDINLGAIQTTTKRLIEERKQTCLSESAIYDSFEVYNVNNYELFRNPLEAKNLLVEALEIEPVSGTVYDGEKDGFMVKVMPVNRIATRQDLNDLIANFPYKVFEKRREDNPNKPVESVMLVCMGHEADIKAHLEQECGYKINVKVVDILRDKSNIEFKRSSEAELSLVDGKLEVVSFYPMNLMQKLSLQKQSVSEWRELVDSIVIDWNYDGAAMEPAVIDIPGKKDFVSGVYLVPQDAGTIKVKITDLLSESYEEVIKHG
ncbi:DNA modification methylase [Zhongshania antarctica]|uniref:site-specific DNA-methyltransferase (adenine-specific) n=1 Tax=Zhongshania antarctica TaxID=641702 RepID=A0A840R635_9GAMM|nr:site-specific DNA-methyltransferase [Zhongshania antarctica]MBB5188297.1 DNA modification methylase [Zhongshania antarctica]